MLRIQFDGLVIELGRDREGSATSYVAAALPMVLSWLASKGFAPFGREPPPPPERQEPN